MPEFADAFGKIAIRKDPASPDRVAAWRDRLIREGLARKVEAARGRRLSSRDLLELAEAVFREVAEAARAQEGVELPGELRSDLLGELSGLGPIVGLIRDPAVTDIALNLHHLWVYRVGQGWSYAGPAPEGLGAALRVQIEAAGAPAPLYDRPFADAAVRFPVWTAEGIREKGLRISMIVPPASPYGDLATIRVADYGVRVDLARLTAGRLPPPERPPFSPVDLPRGKGVLSPEAAHYLLAVLVRGGVVVVAGETGSGKTTLSRALLQGMLDRFPKGAIRMFLIEDTPEIVLHGWSGRPEEDTGNVVYTLSHPGIPGGPPPVTPYDLIRAALRFRPDGIVLGEARGAEAWELVRAAATGHGRCVFTIHAPSADGVWGRFLQAARAHPDAARADELTIAQAFADAVTALVHITMHPLHGQVATGVLEVSPVVEKTAGRPTVNPLFRLDPDRGELVPTGNRPMRKGFTAEELGLPPAIFRRPA